MQDGGLSLLLAFLDPEFLISNTLSDSNNLYEKQKGSIAWSAVCPLIRPPSPIALSSKREVHGYLFSETTLSLSSSSNVPVGCLDSVSKVYENLASMSEV